MIKDAIANIPKRSTHYFGSVSREDFRGVTLGIIWREILSAIWRNGPKDQSKSLP
jgi:hypothetical protein